MSNEVSRRFFIGSGAAVIAAATLNHPVIAVAKSSIETTPDFSKLRNILAGQCQQRLPSRVSVILKDTSLNPKTDSACTSDEPPAYSLKEIEFLSGRHIQHLKP